MLLNLIDKKICVLRSTALNYIYNAINTINPMIAKIM